MTATVSGAVLNTILDPLFLYYAFGVRYLRIFLFCIFASGVQILCANFFPAIGKAKLGMVCFLLLWTCTG